MNLFAQNRAVVFQFVKRWPRQSIARVAPGAISFNRQTNVRRRSQLTDDNMFSRAAPTKCDRRFRVERRLPTDFGERTIRRVLAEFKFARAFLCYSRLRSDEPQPEAILLNGVLLAGDEHQTVDVRRVISADQNFFDWQGLI